VERVLPAVSGGGRAHDVHHLCGLKLASYTGDFSDG
jgi:hypothetical protein